MKSLTYLFLLFAFSAGAQSSFYYGVELFPNVTHRRLVAQSVFNEDQYQALEAMEQARFAYGAGIVFNWQGQKAGFLTGIRASDLGYQTIKLAVEADDPAPQGATQKFDSYRHYYLEFPAELQFFQQVNEKNRFLMMMGLAFSYNLGNARRTTYLLGDTRETQSTNLGKDNFGNFNTGFQAGMGWERQLGQSTLLFVQPTFQFWMKTLYIETEINRNLYTIGVRAGVKFAS
ncbi:MAG TPA: hypothetical protein PKA00_11585 [Saprospiraceae bacterium]|nr:hypothetical protein [Saprospiraceae bacterium]HMQ83545.1 hypothetical protein [Saprospiraceae bacterium]